MSKSNAAAFAAVFVFGAAGCARKVEFVPSPPPTCPPVPALPLIMETEMMALEADVYRRLVERDLRLKEYAGQLRSLCNE